MLLNFRTGTQYTGEKINKYISNVRITSYGKPCWVEYVFWMGGKKNA